MLGLNEASEPAKEFGALSLLIILGVGPGAEFGQVARGLDRGAYRFGPTLSVDRQRLVGFVQRPPQSRPATIRASSPLEPTMSTVPES